MTVANETMSLNDGLNIEDEESSANAETGKSSVNVGVTERQISVIAGSVLAIAGLSRRSLPGAVAAAIGAGLIYRGATGKCGLYKSLNIDTSDTPASPERYYENGIHVEQSVTIEKPRAELFAKWRDFTNLPQWMTHLKSVEVHDRTKSKWTADAPAGQSVSWEAEIINEEPDTLIAWRSLGGALVANTGSVRFIDAPGGDRGTEVKVVLEYIPPAGQVGKWVASMFGREPSQEIQEDLRRFKSIMEAGEAPIADADVRGQCRA